MSAGSPTARRQRSLCVRSPRANIWHATHILGVVGIWGIKEVNAGLRGTSLRWATANGCLARGILRMGVDGAAKKLGEAIVQTFTATPLAAVFISSGLVEHTQHSGPPR
eukprot:7319354-Alexandrium_andersonii.AAC.1